jgi:mannose-6-phosphate isomerase-like protein (cupin superfamily)
MANRLNPANVTAAEMEKLIARFKALRGSNEAYVDSRLPGHRRRKINLIGMGVVESTSDPGVQPNIPLAAHGFNLGMIVCEPGNGAALHAHKTEEVFMPLVGSWAVIWKNVSGEQEIVLDPFDTIHVPAGVYRGFRYIGPEPEGTLLTIVGGPEWGKVEWAPEVYELAEKTGLVRDRNGELVIKGKAPT